MVTASVLLFGADLGHGSFQGRKIDGREQTEREDSRTEHTWLTSYRLAPLQAPSPAFSSPCERPAHGLPAAGAPAVPPSSC